MALKDNYLQINSLYFCIGLICIIVCMVYILQEYMLIPQLNSQTVLSETLKEQLQAQFYKYRWLSFLISPAIFLIRVCLVGGCLFIGGILFNDHEKPVYATYFNVALKTDSILILSSVLYCILLLSAGEETATATVRYTSLLALFNPETIEPWLLVPVGVFNVFELLYWLFMAWLLSAATRTTYRKSFNFVLCTYGAGLTLYILFMIFIGLYVSQ